MAGPIRHALIAKSREAALTAVQTFNNPLVRFKAETFIVLMTIAWTYLMHANYARDGVDIRYLNKDPTLRRKFERTADGGYRWWELTTCLRAAKCPLDRPTILNLEFLIGLRNEIEHHRPPHLDDHLSSRYLACALNYEFWLVKLFGAQHSMGNAVAMALQFRDIAPADTPVTVKLPSRIASYIERFEGDMTDDEFNSPRFAYRLIFQRRTVNHRGQADRAIEFLSPSDATAAGVPSTSWVTRETERPKYQRKEVLEKVKAAGYSFFTPTDHTELWRRLDAKNPKHSYGVLLGGQWFWYGRWIEKVLEQCETIAAMRLTPVSPSGAAVASGLPE
jgi:hypothetical protein